MSPTHFTHLVHLATSPGLPLDTHLDGGETPVLTVVVAPLFQAGPRPRLLLAQDRQDAEDDGDARVQGDAHQALRHAVSDVLEVHGLALDQHPDGDQGVEGAGRAGGRRRRQRRQIRGRAAEEVAGRGPARRRRRLNLGGGEEAKSVGNEAAATISTSIPAAGEEQEEGCEKSGFYRWTAMGSSQDPGTDWTTILESFTPHWCSFAMAPFSSGSMMLWFHRAWTMPMRRPLPSWTCGAGPLLCMAGVEGDRVAAVGRTKLGF